MYYNNVNPGTYEYNNIILTSNYRKKYVLRSDMCFSVEVSSSVGSRRNYTLYTHTHYIYISISVASGSWFIITIIIRGHSPLSRPKVFSVLLLLQYYSFFPFLSSRLCSCVYTYDSVCIPFQVCTASRVNTRRSLVIFGTLTQTQIHTRATWSTVSGFRSLAGPTKWNWHVDRRGFLGLLDRNENIAPKFYIHRYLICPILACVCIIILFVHIYPRKIIISDF